MNARHENVSGLFRLGAEPMVSVGQPAQIELHPFDKPPDIVDETTAATPAILT